MSHQVESLVELDRQVERLIGLGYPELAGKKEAEFRSLVEPLKYKLAEVKWFEPDFDEGELPFVVVVKKTLVDMEKAMEKVERDGQLGMVNMYPVAPADFEYIESVEIPTSDVYLLVDIDRGKETLNVRPEDALKLLNKQQRSPLTIDEGVAIVTAFPDFLMKNNCFSLLASRRNDQRVPAIWISQKRPKLGWCWDRNPHTWLGSAAAGARLG